MVQKHEIVSCVMITVIWMLDWMFKRIYQRHITLQFISNTSIFLEKKKMKKRKSFLFRKVSYDSVYFQNNFTIGFLSLKRIDVIPVEPPEIIVFSTQLCRFWNFYFFFFQSLWINDADNNINNDVMVPFWIKLQWLLKSKVVI